MFEPDWCMDCQVRCTADEQCQCCRDLQEWESLQRFDWGSDE